MPTNIKWFYGEDEEAVSIPGQFLRHAFFWPQSPFKRKELMQVKRNYPDVYQSTYQCRPGMRTGSIFVEDDFAYYVPPDNLNLGILDPETKAIIEKGHAIVCAWDTAFEATSAANHTVCVTGLLIPCQKYHRGEAPEIYGECDQHFDVLVLDVLREKIQWGDLVQRFRYMHRKWIPTIHVIEKRANGINLYHSMQSVGINVEGVNAQESKRARAVEGTKAGSVQGWFRQHRVQFPIKAPWLRDFETELKDFTGDKSGTDDQVDALVHLVNYAIQLSQNMFMLPSEWEYDAVDQIMGMVPSSTQLQNQDIPDHMLQTIDAINFIRFAPRRYDDPKEGLCISCINQTDGFCGVQKRRIAMFESCAEYTDGENYNIPI